MKSYKKVGLKRPRKRLSFVKTTIHSLYWGEIVLNRYVSISDVEKLYPSTKKVVYVDPNGREVSKVIASNSIFK